MNKAGLRTGNVDELHDPSLLNISLQIPLDPLTDLEYLSKLCSLTLNHFYLPEHRQPNDTAALSDSAKQIIHKMWVKTLGIPRAIEFLFQAIHKCKDMLVLDNITNANEVKIFEVLYNAAASYFSIKKPSLDAAASYGIPEEIWQRICLCASLCLPAAPSNVIYGYVLICLQENLLIYLVNAPMQSWSLMEHYCRSSLISLMKRDNTLCHSIFMVKFVK